MKVKLRLNTIAILMIILIISLTSCGGESSPPSTKANKKPVANIQSLQIEEGFNQTITLTATDADNDKLTYQILSQPKNGSLTGNAPNLVYTPKNEFVGTDTFTFKVNDGKDDSETVTITITVIPNITTTATDELIDNVSSLLNDQSKPMTQEEFQQTEAGKNHLSKEDRKSLEQAFSLVSSYKEVDPDSQWFSTELSQEFIFATAGDIITVSAKKLDFDGIEVGDINNSKVKLVVAVQTMDGIINKIDANKVSTYASFKANTSKIEIHVPKDLNKGRLLVGIRPNLNNAGANALAERWSTLIDIEIWPLQQNVQTLSVADVLFPIGNSVAVLSPDSLFPLDEIAEEMQQALNQNELFLPLVIRGANLKTGQLIHHTVENWPYGGRVEKITTRGNQQLVLLAPDWFDVYDVPNSDGTSLKDVGVVPKHVIYRNEIPSEANLIQNRQSNVLKIRGIVKKTKSYFISHCSKDTTSDESSKIQRSLLFSPFIKLRPFDIGINFNYSMTADEAECVWKANKSAKPGRLGRALMRLGGGVLTGLLGTDIETSPYGEFKIKISSELPALLGVTVGWSKLGGTTPPNISFVPGELIGNFSNDLLGASVVLKGEAAASAGVKTALNLVSSNGLIGWVIGRLGDRINIPDIGLTASAGIKGGLSIQSATPAAVYKDDEISKAAINLLTAELKLSASNTIKNLMRRLFADINLEFGINIPLIEGGKVEAKYLVEGFEDDFNGKASIKKLVPSNEFLAFLITTDKGFGVMGPEDEESSIFGDNSTKISYKLDECDANGNQITAFAIVCKGGVFCGKSDEVSVCSDPSIPLFGEWKYTIGTYGLSHGITAAMCDARGGITTSANFATWCENAPKINSEDMLLPIATNYFSNLGCKLETENLNWGILITRRGYEQSVEFYNGHETRSSAQALSNCPPIYDVTFWRERKVFCPKGYFLDGLGIEHYSNGSKNSLGTCRPNKN